MRINLSHLEWLSLGQAVARVQDLGDKTITKEDLISHCLERRLPTYCVFLKPLSVIGYPGSDVESSYSADQEVVIPIGPQLIDNPDCLASLLSGMPVLLNLDGRFTSDMTGAGIQELGKWYVQGAKSESIRIVLSRASVDDFAITVAQDCTDLSPPKPSHLYAIAALLELLTERPVKHLDQAGIAEELDERYAYIHGVSESSLQKMFAEANKALANKKRTLVS